MDNTQGNIIIALLVIIVVLLSGKWTTWLRYDTGGNETERQGRGSDDQSIPRPNLKIEPKPNTA